MCQCGNSVTNINSGFNKNYSAKVSSTPCNGTCANTCGGSSGSLFNSCDTTIITPLKIIPITCSEEASNTYSIQTEIPRGFGSTYTRQAEGDTNEELIASVHNNLVEVVVDIARSHIGEDYTGPPVFNGTVHLANLQAFQNYFSNTGSLDPDYIPVTNPIKKANLDYITQTMYPVFLSIQNHIEDNENSLIICSSGGSRVLRIIIRNCKFCLIFIYN
jgi:hypothetical protein